MKLLTKPSEDDLRNVRIMCRDGKYGTEFCVTRSGIPIVRLAYGATAPLGQHLYAERLWRIRSMPRPSYPTNVDFVRPLGVADGRLCTEFVEGTIVTPGAFYEFDLVNGELKEHQISTEETLRAMETVGKGLRMVHETGIYFDGDFGPESFRYSEPRAQTTFIGMKRIVFLEIGKDEPLDRVLDLQTFMQVMKANCEDQAFLKQVQRAFLNGYFTMPMESQLRKEVRRLVAKTAA